MLWRILVVALAMALAWPRDVQAGGSPGGATSGATQACHAGLPPLLGGCGLRSPYQDELRGGVTGFGGAAASVNHVNGWIGVLNTGPSMPHLIIGIVNQNSFLPRNVYASFDTGTRRFRRAARVLDPGNSPFFWDFGRFPAGAVAHIHFQMRLTNGCSYDLQVTAYGNTLPDGEVDLQSAAWGGGFGASGGLGSCGGRLEVSSP